MHLQPLTAVEKRALVLYRAILGGQGAERKREDGSVGGRGVSEKVRVRLTTEHERRLTAEILTRRVSHFTKGVLIGSRSFIDGWFEANRGICQGRSRTERKRGSRSWGHAALRGLYALRDPQSAGSDILSHREKGGYPTELLVMDMGRLDDIPSLRFRMDGAGF